ncbi:hypothetical protein KEM48_013716 [Puccinia striiformis f. sp. tritici PST-130]|nr:hypothetical protein KEM48_013716 [Puccinia striiformis f. sp. tritici PST-130]
MDAVDRKPNSNKKFIIYPLDVVKSRLQRDALASSIVVSDSTSSQQNSMNNRQQQIRSTSTPKNSFGFRAAFELFKQLISKSNGGGIRVLYSGLSISAFRSFFQHGVMWTILERVRNQIQSLVKRKKKKTSYFPTGNMWEENVISLPSLFLLLTIIILQQSIFKGKKSFL